MNDQMRESRQHLSACVYDNMAVGRRGVGAGSWIGLEEMGLLLRRLCKSSEDISDHICFALFLVCLCTYGAEHENKDYLNNCI